MQNLFYLLGPFIFLGSADFRGNWLVGILRAVVRIALLFAGAFGLTWLTVKGPNFTPPSPDALARQICLVLKPVDDAASCFPTSAEDKARASVIGQIPLERSGLHENAVSEQLEAIDPSIKVLQARFAVQSRARDGKWTEVDPSRETPNHEWSAYRIIAQHGDSTSLRSVTVLRVEPALSDLGLPFAFNEMTLEKFWVDRLGLPWPFRVIAFDTSPYILSGMIVTQANADLSSREQSQAKSVLDAYLNAIPSARSEGLVWPRRLNGPVQYSCYLLFYLGLLMIFFHWTASILPNRLLSLMSEFKVKKTSHQQVKQTLPVAAETAVRTGVVDIEDGGDEQTDDNAAVVHPTDAGNLAEVAFQPMNHSAFARIRAPWAREGDPTDLDHTIFAMEEIRRDVRRRSNFLQLGAVPPFVKLDVWIAGLLAMKASRSGENVPAFISVEIDAAAERFEAHQRLVGYISWAIPTLGFIGTVIGIGTALLATVDLQSSEVITRLSAESRVSVEIGVAFDTTLVALALSFLLMLAINIVQQVEEITLSDEKHQALRALVQIQNILPDDPIKELRDGLAQMGLSAAQVERWTHILDEKAPLFRETMDMVEYGISSAQIASTARRKSNRNQLLFRIFIVLLLLLGGLLWFFGFDILAVVGEGLKSR